MRVRHLPSSECLKKNADAKVDAEAAEDGIVHDDDSVKPYWFRDGGSDARIPNVRLPFAHNEEVSEYGEDDISGAPHEGEVGRHGTRLLHVEPEEEADERDEDRVEAPWFCGGGQGFMGGGSVGDTSFPRHRGVFPSAFMECRLFVLLENPECKCTSIERMEKIKGDIIPCPNSKSPLTFSGVPFWGLETFEAKFVKLSIVDRAQSSWWVITIWWFCFW